MPAKCPCPNNLGLGGYRSRRCVIYWYVAELMSRFTDPRIKIIYHTQNKSPGPPEILELWPQVGNFILPLDGDDQLALGYLEHLVSLLANHPEIDCAFH